MTRSNPDPRWFDSVLPRVRSASARRRVESRRGSLEHSRLRIEQLEQRQLLAIGPYTGFLGDDVFGPAVAGDSVADASEATPWTTEDYEGVLEEANGSATEQASASRAFVRNQLVVALRNDSTLDDDAKFIDSVDWDGLLGPVFSAYPSQARSILTTEDGPGRLTLAELTFDGGPADGIEAVDIESAIETLETSAEVAWARPNFVYEGPDPRDLVPDDPQYGSQFHHPLMQNDLAWDTTLGDPSIVIAVTDDGVDYDHVDLADNIWVNLAEANGMTGVDDDANGFIDDINGWDFSSGDNDPDHEGTDNHGTHVAGITAGVTNNATGIAGTAGAATIMPLRFYGSGAWTSTVIADTFGYATDNGAQIVTTSYNMDGWVGDATVTAAYQYMHDNGVLHLNSAGNGNQLNPPRQAFEQTLLVASTTSTDARSSFSNYGTGIDIAAPGSSILSTLPNDTYGSMSGTSMAAPNAAGVAALIWSATPTWTSFQVAAALIGTADNIDAVNPGYEGLLGSGRANSFRGVTEVLPGPRVDSLVGLPADGESASDPITGFQLDFDQILEPAGATAATSYELRNAGADGSFDTPDDTLVSLAIPSEYLLGTNLIDIGISGGALGIGSYRMRVVSGGITNPFGTPLDGDGNGVPGDHFETFFDIVMPPFEAVEPLGSMVYDVAVNGGISVAGEIDIYDFSVDSGQSIGVVADPDAALDVEIRLVGPAFDSGWINSNGVGLDEVIQRALPPFAGAFQAQVRDSGSSTGPYALQIILNAAVEEEAHDGPTNHDLASAQDVTNRFSFFGGGGAMAAAVLGVGDGGGDFSDSLTQLDTAYFPNVLTYDFVGTPTPISDGTLTVDAFTDLDSTSEYLTLDAEGVFEIDLFVSGGVQQGWVSAVVDITQAQLDQLLADDGEITFTVTPSSGVNNLGSQELTLTLEYPSTPSSLDYYSLGLTANDSTTFALVGGGLLELLDGSGALVATGTSGPTNLDRVVGDFVVPSSGTYYVRVAGASADYNLVITRNAALDTEPNSDDTFVDAQSIMPSGEILGYSGESSGSVVVTPETEPNDDGVSGGSTTDLPFANDLTAAFGAVGGDDYQAQVTGQISSGSDGDWDFFRILATPGDSLTVAMNGISLGDTILRLYNNSGVQIAYDDDGGPGWNSLLNYSAFPYEGDYYVVADSFGSYTGTYAMTATITTTNPLMIGGAGDYLQVSVSAGDNLVIETFTPSDGAFEFLNELDPGIEVFDPTGTPVAHVNVAGNETMSFTASLTGLYTIGVFGEQDTMGEYVLSVDGHTGPMPPFEVVASDLADGDRFSAVTVPAQITIDLNDPAMFTTAQAGDLKMDGIDATAVTQVDGDTLVFDLPAAALTDGFHDITIAAGALEDLQGTPIEPFSIQIEIDATAPRVTESSILPGDTFAFSGTLTPTLVYEADFDEELLGSLLTIDDVTLVGARMGSIDPLSFSYSYDPAPGVADLSVEFEGVEDDFYTLTLGSGSLEFQDLVGNGLDGEYTSGLPSGDGVPGGDFVVTFDQDLTTGPYAVPLEAVEPLGSLIHDWSVGGRINFSAGDTDTYTIDVDTGQTITVVGDPDASADVAIRLTGPGGVNTGIVDFAAVGAKELIQTEPVVTGGTFTVEMIGSASTTGAYALRVIVDAAVEIEAHGGATNNDAGSAQDLGASFVSLDGATAQRGAVLGQAELFAGLVASTVPFEFEDVSGTGTAILTGADDGFLRLDDADLGDFEFDLFGTTYNELYVNSNGLITFGAGTSASFNTDLTSSPADAAIAVLWDDLDLGAGGVTTSVFWEVRGSGANERLIVQWEEAQYYPYMTGGDSITFQAVLSELDNSIQLNYEDITSTTDLIQSDGAVATAGIKDAGTQGDDRILLAYNDGPNAFVGTDKSTRLAPVSPSDFYSFTLGSGESATLTLKGLAGEGELELDLYDASGTTLLATGVAVDNIDQVINNYVEDQGAGTYLARVSASGEVTDYSLVVTRNVDFDIEVNDELDTAQELAGIGGALGYLTGPPPAPVAPPAPTAPPTGQAATGDSTVVDQDGAKDWDIDDDGVKYVPGRLIVRFADSIGATAQAEAVAARGGVIVQELSLVGAVVVELGDSEDDVLEAAAEWAGEDGVVYAEPDYLVQASAVFPNDPEFDFLWAMHNTGQSSGTPDADIDAPEAWDILTGSSTVVVADIDTGVDYNHVDLADNMWKNMAEFNGSVGVDDDGNGYVDDIYGIDTAYNDSDPMDGHDHGTHTSGTIGAVGNEGVGIAGVNWDVEIMALKFLSDAGGGSTVDAIECIEYMVDMKTNHGVNLVASNNSWGGGGFSQALMDAIEASNNVGIMFVAAAGNSSTNNDTSPHYPSNYDLDGLISVTATDRTDAQFYNYGLTTVDVGAPGRSIYSTIAGDNYALYNGTSMATPHVTGAVALLSAYNPNVTIADIKTAIMDGSDQIPSLDGMCVSGGRLNLAGALAALEPPGDPGDFYRLEVNAGDALEFVTNTPSDGPGEFVNLLDPVIELYDPTGALVGSDDNSGADGRNASLSHAALLDGTYTARVLSAVEAGEYVLSVSGNTGVENGPLVTASNPYDGEKVPVFPTAITLDFSESLLITSVEPGDLRIDGVPRGTNVTIIDGDTFEFAIDPASNVGDKTYTVEILGGNVLDLQGMGSAAYIGTFILDTTSPRIVGTSWNGAPMPAPLPPETMSTFEEGPLNFEAFFDEELYHLGSAGEEPFDAGADDILLQELRTGQSFTPNTVAYESLSHSFEADYLTTLPEGDYTLTLVSGDAAFEDVVGNDLDGEPLGGNLDATPTGNGLPGGDYVIGFAVDRIAPYPALDFDRLAPHGGLMSVSRDNTGLINWTDDVDSFEFFVEGGQTVSAILTPEEPSALSDISINGGPWVSSVVPGQAVVLPSTTLAADGNVTISVRGDLATDFTLDIYLNASLEAQVFGGDTDDGNELLLSGSQGSFVPLGAGGRWGVVGTSEPNTGSRLVGVAYSAFNAIEIDVTTGTGTPLSGTINASQLNSLAADSAMTLWSEGFADGSFNRLVSIDPGTGASTAGAVLDFGGVSSPSVKGLSRSAAGELHSINANNELFVIDTVTGVGTLVVDAAGSGIQGLAFAPDGTLYGWNVQQDGLVTIDLTTGAIQDVGIGGTGGHIQSLTFASDGTLYGAREQLYVIDRATGVETAIGTGTGITDLRGIDFVSGFDLDEYTIDLSGSVGRPVDIVLALQEDIDFSGGTLELLDPSGLVIAVGAPDPLSSGVPAENYDLGILDFVVPNIGSNIYTVRLTSTVSADYGIVVTDSLTFDTEINDALTDPLRPLVEGGGALGYLGTVVPPDFFEFYVDRPSFDTVHPNLPVEDFEEGTVSTGGLVSFAGPLDENTDNAAFVPGDLLPGISIEGIDAGNPSDELVLLGAGFLSNTSKVVGPNYFTDGTDITFPNDDVFAVGMSVMSNSASSAVYVTVYGPEAVVLGTTAISVTGTSTTTFFGVAAGQPISRITIASGVAELVDDVAFGPFGGLSAFDSETPQATPTVPVGADMVFGPGAVSLSDAVVASPTPETQRHEPSANVYLPPRQHVFRYDEFLTPPAPGADPFEIAIEYVTANAGSLGLTAEDLTNVIVTDQYTSVGSDTTHVYLRQSLGGLEVVNADMNVNIAADGRVINVGSSFVPGLSERASSPETTPQLSANDALSALSEAFDWTYDATSTVLSASADVAQSTVLAGAGISLEDIPAKLHYVPTETGVELAWQLIVQTVDGRHWYDASVSALDGNVVYWTDWADEASYEVFAMPAESPIHATPANTRTIEVDPQDLVASPYGWHDTDGSAGAEYTITRGNNVHAYADRNDDDNSDGGEPDGGASLVFGPALDLGLEPSTYEEAAVTNLFYWNNVLHDVHYQYGFDEVSGNFQFNTYGRGGAGGDDVRAEAQDGADTGKKNNANFMTPSDGSRPRMQMFVWDLTTPMRDGDFDNGIIVHEYGHGVSNRLTGGPANSGALSAIQSRGMGEGWSDTHALLFTQEPSNSPNIGVGIGTYALGQDPVTGAGIRTKPYAYNMTINPHTYGDIVGSGSVHYIGETWCSTLWDMNWLLIEGSTLDPDLPAGLGFDPDLYGGTGGNNLAMQLIMDGMKLQPANPSFLDARDAILLADVNLTGGANQLAIWKAFARRGMGFSAYDGGSSSTTSVTEAFDLPATSAGLTEFDQVTYEPGDVVSIRVRDIDLFGTGTVNVQVTSTGGDSETVNLTETPAVGVFEGTISSVASASPTPGSGNLEAIGGDVVTVTYNDADDGTGSPAVVTDNATFVLYVTLFDADFSDNATGAPFDEGFVVDNTGATVPGLWHLSTGRGADAGHTADDSFYFGTGEGPGGGGNYNVGDTAGRITSPPVDLNGLLDAQLSFNYFLDSEGGNWDVPKVQLSADGGAFVTLAAHLADTDPNFAEATYDLTDYLDSVVTVRFDFDTIDPLANNYEGWYVDDVVIRGAIPDMGLVGPTVVGVDPSGTAFNQPISEITIDFSEPITAVSATSLSAYDLLEAGPDGMFNTGDDLNIPVTPTFDGVGVVTLAVSPPYAPLAEGSYRLTVNGDDPFAIMDLDGNPLNSLSGPGGGSDHFHQFTVEIDMPSGDIYTLDLQAGEVVRMWTETPLDNPANSPRNELNPALGIYDANGFQLDGDLGAADGKNADMFFLAPETGTYFVLVEAEDSSGEYLLGWELLDGTVELEYTSASGSFVVGLGNTLPITISAISATEDLTGFQLNFDHAAITPGELVLNNWATGGDWALPADPNLDTAVGDVVVGAASSTPIGIPTALGTFDVVAPDTVGTYLLTADRLGLDPFGTGIFGAGGGKLAIIDFGDVFIEVIEELIPPEGTLNDPLNGELTNQDLGYVEVLWTDPGSPSSGIDWNTIDVFDVILTNGDGAPLAVVGATTDSVAGTARYAYAADALEDGTITVEFVAGQVTDMVGNPKSGSTESFTYDGTAPSVTAVVMNDGMVDPPDLPLGTQPTSWVLQRSDIRNLVITFTEEIQAITPSDLELWNLGVNAPADPDTEIVLTASHISQVGNTLTLDFAGYELPDGVYTFAILPTVKDLAENTLDGDGNGTPGDPYVMTGSAANRFYKLGADFNGDTGVSMFDWSTFNYWFGQSLPAAPSYADLNADTGISMFDWPTFNGNFGKLIVFPSDPLLAVQVEDVTVNFEPDVGVVTYEAGTKVVTVDPGTTIVFTAQMLTSTTTSAFQLSFENSQFAAGQLVLDTWALATAWPLPSDGILDTSIPDVFVAASHIIPVVAPADLGTFAAHAPTTNGDYLMTILSNPGPFGTGFLTATGINNIVDYGDVIVRVGSQLGSLGDLVWNDVNANGLQDVGEPGVDGVTVNLLDGTGTPTGTSTVTAGGGLYSFADLAAGDYIVEFTAPAGQILTTKDMGADDALDSDADPANGRTGVIALAAGQDNDTIDAGLVAVPTVTLAVLPATIVENGGVATFTATLSNASTQDVTVTLGYAGTATSGADYTASATTIVIPAGSLTGTATVTAIDDAVYEGNETVVVSITGVTNGTENGTQQQTTTIVDAESEPTVTLSLNNTTIAENGGVATFTATLSNASTQDVTVNLGYTGSATSGTDYTTPATTIVIPAGSLTGTATVTAIDDAVYEGNETVVVSITGVTNGTENGTQQQTTTIVDAESEPTVTLSLNNTTIAENGGVATFTATLSNASTQVVTVTLGVGGSATSGTDYSTSATTITIPAGSLAGTATVTAIDDAVYEGNETVVVSITGVTNGTENGTQQQTTTIVDAESEPTVTLSLNNTTIAENGGVATFTATLSNASTQVVTVTLGVGGSATSGTDYSTSATTITIPAGSLTGTATVTAIDDAVYEGNETVVVSITGVTNGTENGTQQQTTTIVDAESEPTVTLSLNNTTIVENGGVATVTATLSNASTQDVTVTLGVGGSATSGTDYSTSATTIVIPAGSLTGTATVTAIDDAVYEGNETVVVSITGVTNGTENGTQQQTTTIVDDDSQPNVSLAVLPATIGENGGVATVTATLSNASTQDVTVNLGYTGSATSGADYTPSATSIVIPAGNLTGAATVTAIDDAVVEGNETVVVDITSVTNGVKTGTPQTTTIVDDEGQLTVALSVDNSTIDENAGVATFTATMSNASTQVVTVNLGFTGAAVSGTDYTASATSIVIPIGSTTGTITVTAINDAVFEGDETVVVDITSVVGGVKTGTAQTTTIVDDESQPGVVLTVDDTTIGENGGVATFTATLSNASTQDVTVNLGYTGSATSGTDYTTPATSIVIPAGSLTGTATVTAIDDAVVEGNETVVVDITGVTNGSENGTQQQTTTILDDEGQLTVALSVDNSTIDENAGVATFTATMSNASTQVVTVNLGFTGAAVSGTDYTASATSIVIPIGSTTGTITVTAINDAVFEGDETVVVDITSVVGGVKTGTAQTTTIVDDESQPNVALTVDAGTIAEAGGVATFTATLSNASAQDVTVQLGFTGVATSGADYTVSGVPIVITAGNLSGTATVTAVNDVLVEGDESVLVDITGVTGGVAAGTQQQTTIVDDDTAAASVVDRHVFYNNSYYDGNDPSASVADFAAIAPHTPENTGHGPHASGLDEPTKELGKDALLPGGTATFANYTAYDKGLNGVMVDIVGLAGSINAQDDFLFRVGNDNDPNGWTQLTGADLPSLTVFAGQGTPDGSSTPSDRITLVWPDGRIKGEWLQVIVVATPDTGLGTMYNDAPTGLPVGDVFYFGNAPGEAGEANTVDYALVNAVDALKTRAFTHAVGDAPTFDPYDYNKDSDVSVVDLQVSLDAATNFLTALRFITPSPAAGLQGGNEASDAADVVAPADAADAVFSEVDSDSKASDEWAGWAYQLERLEMANRTPSKRDIDQRALNALFMEDWQ